MAKKKSAKDAAAGTPMEEAMDELESIVEALETGNEPLSPSLEKFERAMALLRSCHDQLDHAAERIEVLTRLLPDGSVSTTPFDATATAARNSSSEAKFEVDDAVESEDAEEEDGIDPASLF